MMKVKLFRFEVSNASSKLLESDSEKIWGNRWVKEEQEKIVTEEMIEDIINDFIYDKNVFDIKINNVDVKYHNNARGNTIHLLYTIIYEEKNEK